MWVAKTPRRLQGFTIVELLIVIVVIAILAAISVVAYNGIQQRATNAKTEQALASWLKAIKLYKADKGTYPGYYACLGEGYPYGFSGSDSSGGQCRLASSAANENTAFVTAMRPYLGNIPTPAFVTAGSSSQWYRGLTYMYAGGGTATEVYIQAAYSGNITCPAPGGQQPTSQYQNYLGSGNTFCHYMIGYTTDP